MAVNRGALGKEARKLLLLVPSQVRRMQYLWKPNGVGAGSARQVAYAPGSHLRL